ncbi:MAG: 30S ribosomal protein S17e [Thermoplasmata archaeon]|nr:30S ribosomal protein S17e [Thermoplasmata archaeon]
MGNVKPAFVKKIALELIEKFPEEFTDDFEKNKMLVERLTTISTKNLRNRVAGYITRLMEDRRKIEVKNEEN